MNLEKYIIVNGLSESEFKYATEKLINLYADSLIDKETKVFKRKSGQDVFIINFPKNIDFNKFKFFVNYLCFSSEDRPNYQIYGYWTFSDKDDITPQLYNERIQLYISSKYEYEDNIHGVPLNGAQTIKFGFSIGEEFTPLGMMEFDFFEKKYTKSDFIESDSIVVNNLMQ